MIISSRIMIINRAPIRYITQLGVAGTWTVFGGGGGRGRGAGGSIGCSSDGGTDAVAGTGVAEEFGGGADCCGDGGVGVSTGDSVVKAPTALQALLVWKLVAITFQ